jgi:hypothetical protein
MYIYCLLSRVSDVFLTSVRFRQISGVITLDKELLQEPAVVVLSDQGRLDLGLFNKKLIFYTDISRISFSSNFDFPAYRRHANTCIWQNTFAFHFIYSFWYEYKFHEWCNLKTFQGKKIARAPCRQILIIVGNAWFARRYRVFNSSISKTVRKWIGKCCLVNREMLFTLSRMNVFVRHAYTIKDEFCKQTCNIIFNYSS